MTCDGDETATAANCDQDCGDTASYSDKLVTHPSPSANITLNL